MTSAAAIFGTYFVLFLVVTVAPQEVPNGPTDVHEDTIPTLSVRDRDTTGQDALSLNVTTEERPSSRCKEILQSFVDESVNAVSCTT